MRLGGLLAGGGSVTWASEISVMISHWIGVTMRAGEMMDSLVGGSMDDSYCLERASALVFREPGQYVTVKSKVHHCSHPTSPGSRTGVHCGG